MSEGRSEDRRAARIPTAGSAGLASLIAVALLAADGAPGAETPKEGPSPEPDTCTVAGEQAPVDQAPVDQAPADQGAPPETCPEPGEGEDPAKPAPGNDPGPKPEAPAPAGPVSDLSISTGVRSGTLRKPDGDRRGRDGNGKRGKRGRQNGKGSGGVKGEAGARGAEPGRPPAGVAFPVEAGSPIPPFLLPIYEQCAKQYGIPWEVLAAINQVETAFGANLSVSSAGAVGWMQFLPSSWRLYGVDANGDGRRDPYDPEDAICAAANYLRAAGAPDDMRRALFAYNHADWYVDAVLALAGQYARIDVSDPLPRARRLDREFAVSLARISRKREIDWAMVLAVLRAQGDRGRRPAPLEDVRAVADRIARAERRTARDTIGALVRSLFAARPSFEPEVAALTRYNRAVGLRGLVEGLYPVRNQLEQRVLDSKRLELYEGGRDDIRAGHVDVRVLTVLLYLAEKYDGIEVTSLISGHGFFARPGVPSAHAFGRAVDIAAIRGTPMIGNQEPGGVAEQTIRDVLMLPQELRPAQVISLFDLGGPSFAAADHDDHIHIGF